MLTVHELRKQGYKVRVQHNRCEGYAEVTGKPALLSKGGTTVVTVETPGEFPLDRAVGTAACHPNENFNRKRGVRIALGRALKQLGLPTK